MIKSFLLENVYEVTQYNLLSMDELLLTPPAACISHYHCTQHSWERAEDKIQLAYGCFQCDSQLHLARSSPTPEHLHKAAPQHTQLGSISEHRTFQVNMLQKRPISSMSSTRTSLNNTPCLRFKHVTAVFLQLQWLYRALLPVKSGADSVGLREMYADFTKPKLSSAFIPQHLRRESSSNFL